MKVSKKEADRYLTAILDTIMDNLQKEGRVVVQGFGSFKVNEHKARMAKKPITGEKIFLPVRKKPVFHVGKELKEIINGNLPASKRGMTRAKATRIKDNRDYDSVHGVPQQVKSNR